MAEKNCNYTLKLVVTNKYRIEKGTLLPWRIIFYLIKVTVGNTNKQSQQSKNFYQIIFKLSEHNSICIFCLGKSNRLWHKNSKETVLLVLVSVYSNMYYLIKSASSTWNESYKRKCSWVTNSNKGGLISEIFHFGQKMYQIKLLSI